MHRALDGGTGRWEHRPLDSRDRGR